MAGIVLVTKPPFLFPEADNGGHNTSFTATVALDLRSEYKIGNYFLFDLRSKTHLYVNM